MKRFLLLGLLVTSTAANAQYKGCIDIKGTKDFVNRAGYTNVGTHGYDNRRCYGYTFSTRFTARTYHGGEIVGAVCKNVGSKPFIQFKVDR